MIFPAHSAPPPVAPSSHVSRSLARSVARSLFFPLPDGGKNRKRDFFALVEYDDHSPFVCSLYVSRDKISDFVGDSHHEVWLVVVSSRLKVLDIFLTISIL